MGKLTTAAAFAAGYVLGARAGRARFEQIKDTATSAWQDPRVQQARETVEDAVSSRLPGQGSTDEPVADVQAEDEVVYSSGPDVEETIDELTRPGQD